MVRLRTALNVAVTRQHISRNVAALIELPKVPKAKKQPPRLADLRRLLDVIRSDRQRAMIYVALGASLRRGEVLGLYWEDVDLANRQVHVHRRVNRVGKGVGLIVRDGAKSDSGVRVIALPQMVVDELAEYRKYQIADRLKAGIRWKGARTMPAVRQPGSSSPVTLERSLSRGELTSTSLPCARGQVWTSTRFTGCGMTSQAYCWPQGCPAAWCQR